MKLKVVLILCLGIFAISCSKPQTSKSKKTISKYFVNGNPELLIAGATLDSNSFFKLDNVEELRKFHFSGAAIFVEKTQFTTDDDLSQDDLEAENMPTDADKTRDRKGSDGFFYQATSESYKLSLHSLDSETADVALLFNKNEANVLNINAISFSGQTLPVEVLHYSLNKNESAFSLLFRAKSRDDGRVIAAFYFSKNTPNATDISYVDSSYNYVAGPGVAVGWDQGVEHSLGYCGKDASTFSSIVNDSLDVWIAQLGDERLKIRKQSHETFPPFTDLNTNCVYVVDKYMTIVDQDAVNGGITLPVINYLSGEFSSANVLMFQGEIDKITRLGGDQNFKNQHFKETLIYELGHFFGLDHKGLGADDSVDSIMSYSHDGANLESYDIEAVQALYPVINR